MGAQIRGLRCKRQQAPPGLSAAQEIQARAGGLRGVLQKPPRRARPRPELQQSRSRCHAQQTLSSWSETDRHCPQATSRHGTAGRRHAARRRQCQRRRRPASACRSWQAEPRGSGARGGAGLAGRERPGSCGSAGQPGSQCAWRRRWRGLRGDTARVSIHSCPLPAAMLRRPTPCRLQRPFLAFGSCTLPPAPQLARRTPWPPSSRPWSKVSHGKKWEQRRHCCPTLPASRPLPLLHGTPTPAGDRAGNVRPLRRQLLTRCEKAFDMTPPPGGCRAVAALARTWRHLTAHARGPTAPPLHRLVRCTRRHGAGLAGQDGGDSLCGCSVPRGGGACCHHPRLPQRAAQAAGGCWGACAGGMCWPAGGCCCGARAGAARGRGPSAGA